jgi:hypothetical protein
MPCFAKSGWKWSWRGWERSGRKNPMGDWAFLFDPPPETISLFFPGYLRLKRNRRYLVVAMLLNGIRKSRAEV